MKCSDDKRLNIFLFAKSHWSDYMTSIYVGVYESECSIVIALQSPSTFVDPVLVEDVVRHHLSCLFPFACASAAHTQCL